jgi:Ca2+-binding RTX toxin-like protein
LGGVGKDIIDGGPPPPNETSPPPLERSANNDDVLLGQRGPDFIDGNLGADRILGDDGDDALFDGENRRGARDILLGGDGNDVLLPGNEPARRDVAVCGGGRDTVYADRTDVLLDCERVLFRAPTPEEFGAILERFFGGS